MASICMKCALDVKSNQNGVACELCGKWFHAKCVGITSEAYKFLKACCSDGSTDSCTSNNGGVMWFCTGCIAPASQMIKNISSMQKRQDEMEEELKQCIKRVSSMEIEIKANKKDTEDQLINNRKEIQALQNEVTDMNAGLRNVKDELTVNVENPTWSSIVNQAVESKFETVSGDINRVEQSIEETRRQAQELREKETRRNNIILYRVPECPPGSYEEIIKHDTDVFLEICESALGLDITTEDLKKVYRIGQRGTEPRPLLIQLSSGMLKNHIMETTFKLRTKEKFECIGVSHDMTKTEREQCRKLVAEAKQKESRENTGEYIYRVRGPPGDMKIVKLKKRF